MRNSLWIPMLAAMLIFACTDDMEDVTDKGSQDTLMVSDTTDTLMKEPSANCRLLYLTSDDYRVPEIHEGFPLPNYYYEYRREFFYEADVLNKFSEFTLKHRTDIDHSSVDGFKESLLFNYPSDSLILVDRHREDREQEATFPNSMEVIYKDGKLAVIREYLDWTGWNGDTFEKRFSYSENSLDKIEEWTDMQQQSDSLVLRSTFRFTYENGNVVKVERTQRSSEVVHEYTYDDKVNPLQYNLAQTGQGHYATFLSKNNILTASTSSSRPANQYEYEYNEYNLPVSRIDYLHDSSDDGVDTVRFEYVYECD